MSATPLSSEAARFEWAIAEGYYLYRDQFSFTALSDDLRIDAQAIHIPRGKLQAGSLLRRDGNPHRLCRHRCAVAARPRRRPAGASAGGLPGLQGEFNLLPAPEETGWASPCRGPQGSFAAAPPDSPAALSAQDRVTERLKQGSLILNIAAFFVFGLFLSLTPCVFPMIPILSGIIVGQSGAITGRRGFLLSPRLCVGHGADLRLVGGLGGFAPSQPASGFAKSLDGGRL